MNSEGTVYQPLGMPPPASRIVSWDRFLGHRCTTRLRTTHDNPFEDFFSAFGDVAGFGPRLASHDRNPEARPVFYRLLYCR